MASEGEKLAQLLRVTAPDHCSQRCERFIGFLSDLATRVDLGEYDVTDDLPLVQLVKSCPRAVELGGHSVVDATRARSSLNSIDLVHGDEPAHCIMSTMAVSHALMYAQGDDPYDGFLQYDGWDEYDD